MEMWHVSQTRPDLIETLGPSQQIDLLDGLTTDLGNRFGLDMRKTSE
jgi:hypothetical protein